MTTPLGLTHRATLLADGRVLVTGGTACIADAPLDSAELYDPEDNSWSAAARMSTTRTRHVSIGLSDGRVLVAGGRLNDVGPSLATAELYDPVGNTWMITGSMNRPRDNYAAVRLADGKVLVSGGINVDVAPPKGSPFILNSAEIYDPATGTWSFTGHMRNARWGHSLILLAGGDVLAAGGNTPGGREIPTRTAEIYNPQTGTWTPTGNLNIARSFYASTQVGDRRVLVAGGDTKAAEGFVTETAELYDVQTGTWTQTGSMAFARGGHGFSLAAQLPDGNILVAGSAFPPSAADTAELYNPGTGTWSLTASMSVVRLGAVSTSLTDGRVLVAGGCDQDGIDLATADVYAP